jgi:hypothetical protein
MPWTNRFHRLIFHNIFLPGEVEAPPHIPIPPPPPPPPTCHCRIRNIQPGRLCRHQLEQRRQQLLQQQQQQWHLDLQQPRRHSTTGLVPHLQIWTVPQPQTTAKSSQQGEAEPSPPDYDVLFPIMNSSFSLPMRLARISEGEEDRFFKHSRPGPGGRV